MPGIRVNLPPGCYGFSDDGGATKILAENGPGSYAIIEDKRTLKKLKNQDYAQAGLVDAGPEKFFADTKKAKGRACLKCIRIWHAWSHVCPKCGEDTVLEEEFTRPKLEKWIP